MRTIPLTQGKVAIVDDEDYDRIVALKWHAWRTGSNWYAIHSAKRIGGKQPMVRMHHLVLSNPTGTETDHINGNGLDNRKANLRPVTKQQNMMNRRPRTNGSSRFKCVSWHKATGKWQAYISVNGRTKHLGLFDDESQAAKAYDVEAIRCFGQYARPNFTKESAPCE